MSECPICHETLSEMQITPHQCKDAKIYKCPNCGSFTLEDDQTLKSMFRKTLHEDLYSLTSNMTDEELEKYLFLLSCYLFETNRNNNTSCNSFEINKNKIYYIFSSGLIPITPKEKVEKLLSYVNSHSKFFGDDVAVVPKNIYAKEDSELKNLLSELKDEYIRYTDNMSMALYGAYESYEAKVRITLKGINYIKEEQTKQFKEKCFIAMWYNGEIEKVFSNFIRPACIQAGYNPKRIEDKHFNGEITSQIIAEIKTSDLVIADLTGLRGGVYYEAGFANGLGKELILCCKKDFKIKIQYEREKPSEMTGPHFDLNHLNILYWEANKLDEFKEKLYARIIETVGKGNYKPKEENQEQ